MLLTNNKAFNDLIIDILIKNNFAENFYKKMKIMLKMVLTYEFLFVLFTAFIIFFFFFVLFLVPTSECKLLSSIRR